jgi:zeta-carotene desaturase
LEQPESFVRRFWSPVIVSACNMDVDRVSASAALHVFQEGFLANRASARIGVPGVPLVELYEHAEEIIASSGGRVLLGEGVANLDERGATTSEGKRYEAGRVICAVPVERVNRIVEASVRRRDPRFAPLDSLTHSPILGVHLRFAAPVMEFPHAVLVDRPTQWLFRKDEAGRYLHAVISAADGWVALSEEEIARRVLEDVRSCFPAARGVELERARAVKE